MLFQKPGTSSMKLETEKCLCQRKYVLRRSQRPRAVDNPFQEAESDGTIVAAADKMDRMMCGRN